MACSNQKLCYQFRLDQGEPFSGKVHFLCYVDNSDLVSSAFINHHSELVRKFGSNISSNNFKFFLVPCGCCTDCRLSKSRDTANRIYLEMKSQSNVWSVTLTYDDDHLPFGDEVVDGQGEFRRYPSLRPDDLRKFNNSLRKHFARLGHVGIKFYAAGEYGPLHGRPHYHCIYFNLPIDDIKPMKRKTNSGEIMFYSELLDRIWNKGEVTVNFVSWQYAAYVGRYIMKKQYGQGAEKYKILGIVPEFSRCSTREGIGRRYFEAHKEELLKADQILIMQGDKVRHVSLPAYFLRLAEKEGYDLEDLKEARRRKAQDNVYKILSEIHDDYFEYQSKLEDSKISRSKSLPRIDI